MTKKISAIIMALVMVLSCMATTMSASAADVVETKDSSTKTTRFLYYPAELKSSSKKYPVILWANGTASRHTLYTQLLQGYAERGYIVVASDVTMAADGTDVVDAIDFVINKSKTSSSPLYNKVATTKITAIGHSQGGRGVVNAAASDSRIGCVVSIAGSNYDYEAEKLKAPTLFLTGTNDSIVSSNKWVKPAFDVCKGAAAYASLIGAKHTTCCNDNDPDAYIDYSVAWMKAWNNADFASLAKFNKGGEMSADTAWQDFTSKNLATNAYGTVTLAKTKYTYDGTAKKPAVTVRNYGGAVISSANYTVTYPTGRKLVGKYKVTVKYTNKLSGTKTATFTIVPKSTTVKSLVATKGGYKASWKKQATQTTGYQLQRATNSKFSAGVSTATVASSSTTAKAFTGLAKGKKYYVRVRTYKTVSGKKYYSSWSSYKTVTTLK